MAKLVRLDQKKKHLIIDGVKIENQVVFSYFDSLPEDIRENHLAKAIAIGVLALCEDRLSALIAKTSNTLGAELEQLKIIYDLQEQLFLKSTSKGRVAEEELAIYLESLIEQRGHKDKVESTGDTFGVLSKNKTGDIVVFIDNRRDLSIVIESKFDKSKKLGHVRDRDPLSSSDTAFSQLLESRINRNSREGIIVFDKEYVDSSILDEVGSAGYYEGVGFVCVVDISRNDFSSLALCYDMARAKAIADKRTDGAFDMGVFNFIVSKLLGDFDSLLLIEKEIEKGIKGYKNMHKLVHKSLLSIELAQRFLAVFSETGTLSAQQLYDFYAAEIVKTRYRAIEDKLSTLLEEL